MRRIFIATLVMSIMLVGQALASRVTHVDLSYQNGATVARIYVDGPIRFTHSTEVPKDGRPDRVIVDVLTATHALGAKEFSNLPSCVISSIRSSQYSVEPEQIVRVVFDLTEAPIYRIDSDQESITIIFDYKNARPFAAWSSAPQRSAPAPTVPQAKPMAQVPVPPVTAAQKNQVIEKDRQASLSTPPKAAPAPAEKPSAKKTPVAAKPTVTSVPPAAPHSAFGNYSEPKPRVAAAPQLNPEPVKQTMTIAEAPAAKQDRPTSAANTAPKASVKAKAAPTRQDSVSKTEAEKSDTNVKTAPAKPARTNDKPAPSPLPVTSSKTTLASAPAKATPVPEKSGAKPTPSKAIDVKAQAPSVKTQVAAKTGDKEPAAGLKNSTSRFRRQATSAKIKGTMIAEFPQRLVVKYESQGRRDPFASLVDDTRYSNNPVETRIPNIEGLKLVGIIASGEQTNRALFEDNSGYSYMLKSGDKVRNGYVLRVEVDQVFFQIFEYGWSRTVALKMD